jgi:predicted CoA-binding protein
MSAVSAMRSDTNLMGGEVFFGGHAEKTVWGQLGPSAYRREKLGNQTQKQKIDNRCIWRQVWR